MALTIDPNLSSSITTSEIAANLVQSEEGRGKGRREGRKREGKGRREGRKREGRGKGRYDKMRLDEEVLGVERRGGGERRKRV